MPLPQAKTLFCICNYIPSISSRKKSRLCWNNYLFIFFPCIIFCAVFLSWLFPVQELPGTQEIIWAEKYQGGAYSSYSSVNTMSASRCCQLCKYTYYSTHQPKLYLLYIYYYQKNLNRQQYFWKILVRLLQNGPFSAVDTATCCSGRSHHHLPLLKAQ